VVRLDTTQLSGRSIPAVLLSAWHRPSVRVLLVSPGTTQYDIPVCGATGFVGQLVAEQLVSQYPADELLDSRLQGLRSPIPNAEKPDEGAKTD
jgi:hypothetical protein